MTICLVTDRGRCDPIAQAEAAVDAGIDLIQIREGDLDGAPLAAIVRAVVAVARRSGPARRTRVVVNDRLDVAVACGADGVHLRGDSMTAAAARAIAPPGFLIGRSVHGADEARSAGPVDYLVAGTVFRTASKDASAPLLGIDGLAAVVRAAHHSSGTPVLAIGGVSVDCAAEIASAGAAGVAAMGLFTPAASLALVVSRLRARFDSVKTAP